MSVFYGVIFVWAKQVMFVYPKAGRPGSSEVPRNPLTRWDVSSIPAHGIFSLRNKTKINCPTGGERLKR